MAGNLVGSPPTGWSADWDQLTGSAGAWTLSGGTLTHAGSSTSGCASTAFAVTPGELLRVTATGSGSIASGARFRVAYGTSSTFASGAVTEHTDLVDAGTFAAGGQEYAGLVTVPAAVTHARLVVYNLAAGACVWSDVVARRLSDVSTPSLRVEVSFGRASNYVNNSVLTWRVGVTGVDNRVNSSFMCPRGGSTPDVAEWSTVSPVVSTSITRGRRSRTDTFESGACTVILDDPDRDYDPLNTNAAADWVINGVSYVGTGRPLRVSLVDGDTGDAIPIFTGRVNSWTPSAELPNRATIQASEDVVTLNAPVATTVLAGQRTDLLLGAILNLLEQPSALRRIDTGTVTTPGVTLVGSTLGTQRMCATVEHGRYYIDGDGSVRFRVGTSFRSSTMQATIDPSSTASFRLDYEKATLLYDNDTLRNRVAGTRLNGSSADSQVADDADSIASFGTHGYTVTDLLFSTNAEVLAWCEAELAANAAPVARVDGIDIWPTVNPSWWGPLMWCDFGDRFTVKVHRFPVGSDVITQTVALEAVKWDFAQLGQILDCRVRWSFVPIA